MNLADGKLIEQQDCDAILESLPQRLRATLGKKWLDPEWVIAACDQLVTCLDEDALLQAMADLGIDRNLAGKYIAEARVMFGAKNLRARLNKELGASYGQAVTSIPLDKKEPVTERIVPLGVLLHVAAGNADALPAFSVLEGLLSGNINILKLPAAEGGISVRLLMELIRIEPALAEYIYVFDYSSKDILHMEQLVALADAIVVWGGAEAVTAFRRLADPNIQLIEWGHKVSFAYVTAAGLTDDALAGLASNMVETGQLLCSSCQGVFVDTDDMTVVAAFCRRFLPVLENVVQQHAKTLGIGIETQIALQLYNEELETQYLGSQVFKGRGCSLIAYLDRDLKPSLQFGNAWVKALPRNQLITQLRPYKNFLQTVGLLCGEGESDDLTTRLWQAGVVRVCPAARMSETYCGAPHDGDYPLRRYTRTVCSE